MFVNFPDAKKQAYFFLVQRAEHIKETFTTDKNKNVQVLCRFQSHAIFVFLMCMKCLFFDGESEYQGGVCPIIRDMSGHAEMKMKNEQVFLFAGFAQLT